MSSSCDRFTTFVRGVPNNRIHDESLKDYFNIIQDDNNKVVLNTIANGSHGEGTYVEIAYMLEKISRKTMAWSTRKSNTRRNTFAVKDTKNPAANEIREDMEQSISKLVLVLKYVN